MSKSKAQTIIFIQKSGTSVAAKHSRFLIEYLRDNYPNFNRFVTVVNAGSKTEMMKYEKFKHIQLPGVYRNGNRLKFDIHNPDNYAYLMERVGYVDAMPEEGGVQTEIVQEMTDDISNAGEAKDRGPVFEETGPVPDPIEGMEEMCVSRLVESDYRVLADKFPTVFGVVEVVGNGPVLKVSRRALSLHSEAQKLVAELKDKNTELEKQAVMSKPLLPEQMVEGFVYTSTKSEKVINKPLVIITNPLTCPPCQRLERILRGLPGHEKFLEVLDANNSADRKFIMGNEEMRTARRVPSLFVEGKLTHENLTDHETVLNLLRRFGYRGIYVGKGKPLYVAAYDPVQVGGGEKADVKIFKEKDDVIFDVAFEKAKEEFSGRKKTEDFVRTKIDKTLNTNVERLSDGRIVFTFLEENDLSVYEMIINPAHVVNGVGPIVLMQVKDSAGNEMREERFFHINDIVRNVKKMAESEPEVKKPWYKRIFS